MKWFYGLLATPFISIALAWSFARLSTNQAALDAYVDEWNKRAVILNEHKEWCESCHRRIAETIYRDSDGSHFAVCRFCLPIPTVVQAQITDIPRRVIGE